MNQVGMYNNRELRIERVFFSGTATLAEGQALCFQEDPASTSITTDSLFKVNKFPFNVQIPDTSNVRVFAGIVAPSSVGFTGPGYIDIVVPRDGDIIKVLASRAKDIAAGDLLSLEFDIATDTDNNTVAAFEQASDNQALTVASYTLASAATMTIAAINLTALLQTAEKVAPLVRALESLASTSTDGSRSLIWVKFQS